MTTLKQLMTDALRPPECYQQERGPELMADWQATQARFGCVFTQAAVAVAHADGLLTYFMAQPKPNDACCRWYLQMMNERSKEHDPHQ